MSSWTRWRCPPQARRCSRSPPYARSFGTQLWTILKRTHRAHLRDVAYNCGRIGVLLVLYILFGIIYFDLDTSDEGGVQSDGLGRVHDHDLPRESSA